MLMSYFMAPVRWCHRCKADMHQTIKKFLTPREQTQTHLQGHSCWVCHTQDGFRRRLRHDALAPTRTSTYTQNFWCQCVCVCLHTCSIVMSHGGVTCYCMWLRSSVVLTGRGGLWDRSGDSGLSDYSRCCLPTVFPVSPFVFLSWNSLFHLPLILPCGCLTGFSKDVGNTDLHERKKIQGLPQNVSNQTLKHARVKVVNCYQAAAV